jgi:feruloyl esterase
MFSFWCALYLLISLPCSVALYVAEGEEITTTRCITPTFASLKLPHAKVISVDSVVAATSWPASNELINAFPSTKNGTAEVCQLTVTYTHPGKNDTINTWVWLPLKHWNGRFVGMGGSGWVTGTAGSLAQPVFEGYSAASTDGGHSASATVESWALNGNGDINWPLLEDFSSVAVNEAALLGKAATKLFYGASPKYSYFNGCSTGGRQGHMLAQQFPAQYDGVLAGSPAINWDKLIPAQYWPPLMMQELGKFRSFESYLKPCKIANSAIEKTIIRQHASWTPLQTSRSTIVMHSTE